MNKFFSALLLASLIASGPAFGQTATTAPSNPPAVSTQSMGTQTNSAPLPGANSFTKAQARDRIQAHGYTNVTALKLDAQSIWRGKAMKNGALVNVALDYKGNVVSQ